MDRAIICRRDGLTTEELDVLADRLTRPRPDMAQFDTEAEISFIRARGYTVTAADEAAFAAECARPVGSDLVKECVSYDEASVVDSGGNRVADLLAIALVCIGLAVLVKLASGWLDVEIIAPTAAEVMAPGFDFEREVVGVTK